METMDILIILAGMLCMMIGIAGCFLPVLPGTPLCYLGVLALHFTSARCFGTTFLVGWAMAVVVIQVLDYIVPVVGTKAFGGGRAGTIGCTVGVVASLFFFTPINIIVFPFVGAVAGELFAGKKPGKAFKAGFGSFLGFVAGLLLKLTASLVLLFHFLKACAEMIF